MSSVGWATLDVIPSFKGLARELDNGTRGPFREAGIKGGADFGAAAGRQASARFGSALRRGVKVAAVGAFAAGAAAIKFGGDALEEAREAQKVGAQTDAVIKSTGKAAKVTAKDVGRLSGRLSDMAGIDDELIQSGANVLLTFKKIRNEAGKGNDIFDQATESALDMSVALGTDLKGATVQVGKALNDPIKGVTALGRAGVQFSEDQKAAIKAMVESGDTLGAQKIILKELDDQFKGSAKAQATEADKLSVAYGNLKEEVGTALIPVMDDLAVFLREKGIPAARDFFGWVQDDGIPALRDFKDQVDPVLGVVKDLVGAFNNLPTSGKIAALGGALSGGLVVKHQVGKLFERGAPANPMFVTVTNPGLGGGTTPDGKPRKGGRGGTIAAIVGSVFGPEIIKEIQDEIMWPLREGPFSPKADSPKLETADVPAWAARVEEAKASAEELDKARMKAAGLGRELDLVGAKKINPSIGTSGFKNANAALADFISKQIEAGRPVTPYINTTSIERALALLRTMNAEIRADALPSRGVDNGTTYQHGGTGTSQRATFDNVTIVAHDYNDFLTQAQRRSQQAGLGGFN